MINEIDPTSDVDKVGSVLKIGGTVLDWLDWDMTHSGIMEAGTFRATIPTKSPKDWAWWAQQTEILVDVYAGPVNNVMHYSADELRYLMRARIDTIDLDPATGHINLAGRDLSSLLIDNNTTDKWPNQTASTIASTIAATFGMGINVTLTTEPVGTYYTVDNVKIANADTYWNILTYLAQHEGFQCHVQGKDLYFGKFGAKSSRENFVLQLNTAGNYVTANARRIKFSRALTLAQDISVTVKSYHGYLGASYSGTATATKTAKRVERHASVQQTTQHYDYTIPGLTQAQCKLRAAHLLSDLSQHELNIEASLPFDTILFPWIPFEVRGSGTPWDAVYSISEIHRRFTRHKVSMNVKARTGIQQQTVVLQ